MQNRAESILRNVNRTNKVYNILTFPVHERYQSNLGNLPHTFYLYQKKGTVKGWNNQYAELPKNHILLSGEDDQIKTSDKFDICLSQNKFGNFQIAKPLSQQLGIPLVSLEHTLPVSNWNSKVRQSVKDMRGDSNLFISEFSIKEWGFDQSDPTVDVIHHAIDTETFKPNYELEKTGKGLVVCNDYMNRDWCCGWNLFREVTKDIPFDALGDTKGFSEAAKDIGDLVEHMQKCSVFFNSSLISPVPMALLENMSVGNCVVSTATCMIPEIIKDGINGFLSNDPSVLRKRIFWVLDNAEEAKKIGAKARETIINRFSLDKHLNKWNQIFDKVIERTGR